MAVLVALVDAKRAARITHSRDDAELERLLDESETLVLDAVKNRVSDAEEWAAVVDAWDESTAPAPIKGAILHQFVTANTLRGGDDPKVEPVWVYGLAPRAWAIVRRYGDPSLA